MELATRKIELEGRGRFEYAEAGSGIPVLLLHGYLDSWYSFSGLAAELGGDVHFMALTQRGHGESWKPDNGYTIANFAADAIAFIESKGVAPVILGGHSMGSMVAQEIALLRPDLVAGLFLMGTTYSADTPVLRGAHSELSQLEDPVPVEVTQEFQQGTCVGPLVNINFDEIVQHSANVPARVWDQALINTIEYRAPQAGVDMSGIGAKTILVWGDGDVLFDRAGQDKMIEVLPNARLEVISGAGHGVHWEHPKACADLLSELVVGI